MSTRRYWIILGAVLGVGALLRIWQLQESSFWIDESYSIALAQAIVKNGWPITQAGLLITRSVLFHYILAGFIFVAGGVQPILVRLPAVLFGVGAIIAAIGVARQLFSQRVAIITAALMATSVWEIAWSRQARMYTALQCGVWLTLYCYFHWRQRPTAARLGLVGLCVVITIGLHELGALVIVLLLLHYGIERLLARPFTWHSVAIYCVGLLGSIFGFGIVMHFGLHYPIVNYWSHYWYYLVTTMPVTMALVVVALYYNRGKSTLPILWLVTSSLFVVGFFSFAILLLQYRYLFFIVPIFYILSAVAIVELWQSARVRWLARCGVVLSVIIAMLVGEYTIWPKDQYLLESDKVNAPFAYKSFTPQPNFAAAYQYLESVVTTNDIVITPYPTIHALYLPERMASCLYIDLTGTTSKPPTATERYTNCQYLTAETLCAAFQRGGSYIILDQFARHRIEPSLYDQILTSAEVAYTNSFGPWSDLKIYKVTSIGTRPEACMR